MSYAGSNRPLVIAGVMACLAMIAIEATIVSTAMPHIAAQLGQINLYSWVFAAFLLAQTAMTVVFGKLADIYGRKPIAMIGIVVFLAGSVLCGFAWSMTSMIAFRLLQGLGAGAIQPVALTIVGDFYPARERGKIQGYLASIWALAAVTGPLAGSVIVEHLPWSWVFWVNVPVGIIASIVFIVFLHEQPRTDKVKIDYPGALLFTVAISAFMVALTEGTTSPAVTVGCLALFVLSLGLFLRQEARADAPMVSLALWRHRPILFSNGALFFANMAIMGLTTFLPMYVQIVLDRSALVAGFALTMLLIGWPIAATLGSRIFPRYGLRRIMIIGSVFVPCGALLLVLLGPQSSPIQAGIGSMIMGFGMGFLNVCALVLVQGSVEQGERGSATASTLFSRNLGSTLGATVLGAILSYRLAHHDGGQSVSPDQLRELLEGGGAVHAVGASVRAALQVSLHATFIGMFVIAALIVVMCLFIPKAAARTA